MSVFVALESSSQPAHPSSSSLCVIVEFRLAKQIHMRDNMATNIVEEEEELTRNTGPVPPLCDGSVRDEKTRRGEMQKTLERVTGNCEFVA